MKHILKSIFLCIFLFCALLNSVNCCPPIQPKKGVVVECKLNGTILDCGLKEIPEGTNASFTCGKYYFREKSPHQGAITCAEDGEWEYLTDYEDFNCHIECGVTPRESSVIVGGNHTSKYDIPWHATIFFRNRTNDLFDLACGGSLIDLEDQGPLILTAAQCISGGFNLADYRVILGATTSKFLENKGPDSQIFGVNYFVAHPLYNITSLENDIALIKLKGDPELSDRVKPICLERGAQQPKIGEIGIVAGFGLTEGIMSENLLNAAIPFRDHVDCARRIPAKSNFAFPASTKFCAGIAHKNNAINGSNEMNEIAPKICFGDAGGGLTQLNSKTKRSEIVGISHAAFKDPLFACSGLGYFQSVGPYIGWIRKIQKRFINTTCDTDQEVVPRFSSYLTLYNRKNESEETFSATYRKQDADLAEIQIHFDQPGFRLCRRGIWHLYRGKDFSDLQFTLLHGSEYCSKSNYSFYDLFKSLRPVGHPDDFRIASITFYEGTGYNGVEQIFFKNVPWFNGTSVFKSLILTGNEPITLFTGENYGGISKCIEPLQEYHIFTKVGNIQTTLGMDPASIKSIQFGCSSKEIDST